MSNDHYERLMQALDGAESGLTADVARLRAKVDRLPTRRDFYLMSMLAFRPRGGSPRPGAALPRLMPPRTVPTSAFAHDLVLRRHGDRDFAVTIDAEGIGTLVAGRIMEVSRPPAQTRWFWSLTGPSTLTPE